MQAPCPWGTWWSRGRPWTGYTATSRTAAEVVFPLCVQYNFLTFRRQMCRFCSGGQNDDFSTFDPYPWGEGHGGQGQICDILRPQLPMNRFQPLWSHRFPHFWYIYLGGGGRNTENSKPIFPEKELRGHSPNSYIHVSVSDLYIPLIGLPILLQVKIGRPNVEKYIDRS